VNPPSAAVLEVRSDPAEELAAWLRKRVGDRDLQALDAARLGQLLSSVTEEAHGNGDWKGAASALLDATYWTTDHESASVGDRRLPSPQGNQMAGSAGVRVRRAARAAFAGLLEGSRAGEMVAWLEQDVIFKRSADTAARRAGIAWIVNERPPSLVPVLLTVARDTADPLRPAVLDLLVRWEDEAVDLFLVKLVSKSFDKRAKRHPYSLLLDRVRDGKTPLGERATTQLGQRLRVMLLSQDWRTAARAVTLAGHLDAGTGVPLLLDALTVWNRRKAEGRGSRRILSKVTDELCRISGRSGMGGDPRSWSTWWVAVQQGQSELHVTGEGRGEARTSAAFFGLTPRSDQVTFIIDKSGSMDAGWGTTGHNRYVEAVEQMTRFLQASGPATRFNVILFSDTHERSSSELVAATPANLARARHSLLSRAPNGGTSLRPAVELALGIGRDGEMDLDRVEADTVVILCDGQTMGGPSWVAPLLDRVGEATQVVFECVLIGSQGDGTLEALAERTGGEFLRVDG